MSFIVNTILSARIQRSGGNLQTGNGDQVLKEREREKLAADVADYLRRGGKIEQVDVTRQTKQDLDKRSLIRFDKE